MTTCAGCATEAPPGSRFCPGCGSPLVTGCPSCGAAPASPTARFCAASGSALGATGAAGAGVPPPRAPAPTAPVPEVTERRVCSVLFADLVGFTPLSEARDPEEVRELLSHYFDTARTIIGRYGGVVEKFIGDAVMAVWGSPVAVEGDAERSVRAGLDLVSAVEAMGAELGADGLGLRAGVVTGEVAATIGAVGQGMVAGDAVNTAARVQSAATPGTVWVDQATHRLAASAVGFRPVGDHLLKGKTEPMSLWEATRVLSNVGGVQRIDGLEAPMVGRVAEERAVRELFHATVERRTPRLVVVSGAAGIGKSRLGWEFEKYVDGLVDPVNWHRGRCLSYGDGVAWWALAEAVRQRLGIAEDEPAAPALERMLARLPEIVTDPEERRYVGVRLGRLLGLTHPDDPGGDLPTEELFAGWRLFLERLAQGDPVVWLVEDAHHADDALLDFVEHLVDWARSSPVFVIVFARAELAERRPGLGVGRNRALLSLDVLDDRSTARLVGELVHDLPEPVVEAVVGQAQGNPLYAVETIRSLIDRGAIARVDGDYRLLDEEAALGLRVPDSLHGLLASRLDALDPPLRALVADAAVLGTSFPVDALVAVSGRPPAEVVAGLEELVRRDVLEVSSDPLSPQRGHHLFTQNLLRQVAYDTLSRKDRRARHLAVADHLQTVFAEGGEEVADVVVQHHLDALALSPAGSPDLPALRDRTRRWLLRAADRAERTGALVRAADHLCRAAAMVTDDDPAEAARLVGRASNALMYARERDRALATAEEALGLSRRTGDPREVAGAEALLGMHLARIGQNARAEELLEGALVVLRADPGIDTIEALSSAGTLAAFSASPRARPLLDEALALAQGLDTPRALVSEVFSVSGTVHLFDQRTEEAIAAFRHAAEVAKRAGDVRGHSRALTALVAAMLVREPRRALELAAEAEALCRREGNHYHLEVLLASRSVGLLLVGEWHEAVAVLRTAVGEEGYEEGFLPIYLGSALALQGLPVGRETVDAARELRTSEDVQDIALLRWYDVVSAISADDLAATAEPLRAMFAPDEQLDLTNETVTWCWPIAVRRAIVLGDYAEADRLLAHLRGLPQGSVPPLLRACRLAGEAMLAAARGEDPDRVARTFADATELLHAAGSPYHLAHVLLDRADHAEATGSAAATGSPAATQAWREEAAALATALGSVDLRRRTASRVAAVPTA